MLYSGEKRTGEKTGGGGGGEVNLWKNTTLTTTTSVFKLLFCIEIPFFFLTMGTTLKKKGVYNE